MTLKEYLTINPSGTAEEYNNLPTRYGKTEYTPRMMVQAFGTQAGDAVVTALATLAESSPSVGLMLENMRNREPMDLGDKETRKVISELAIGDELKANLLAIAPDTHGGDKSEAEADALRPRATRQNTINQWTDDFNAWFQQMNVAASNYATTGTAEYFDEQGETVAGYPTMPSPPEAA